MNLEFRYPTKEERKKNGDAPIMGFSMCGDCGRSGIVGDEVCRNCDGYKGVWRAVTYPCGHNKLPTEIECRSCNPTVSEEKSMFEKDIEPDLCAHFFYKGRDCPKCDKTIEIIKDESFDPVNRPSHYNQYKIEPIKVVEDWKLGYHLGNALKYIVRSPFKGNQKQDLKKAIWYIQRYIDEVISEEPLQTN